MKKNDSMMDTVDRLSRDVEIPDIVMEKANQAFEQIRREGSRTKGKIVSYQSAGKRSGRKYAVIALTATLAVGTVTACAAYMNWSRGLTEELRISESQQENLEQTGMAAFSGASVSDAGVTVTAEQSITDNYYTYLSFKVEGYSPAEGVQPDFETISVTVDGKDDISWGGGFYDGLVCGNDGMVINADGSEAETEEDGSLIEHYVMDDGSLEYHMVLSGGGEEGAIIGKDIRVSFENLGSVAKAEYTPDLEGKWTLEWTLGGADTAISAQTEETLGDTGATVTGIELSPISIRVTYDFPRKERISEYEDENGERKTYTYFDEPPVANGVKLKDGTMLTSLYGGPGSAGYLNDESDTYQSTFAFSRVIDPEQVAAVLFPKRTEGEEGSLKDMDYYEVAIGE